MPSWFARCLYGVQIMVALMVALFFPAPLFSLAVFVSAVCLFALIFASVYGFLSVVRSVCRIE